MRGLRAAVCVALVVCGCGSREAFLCTSSSQCVGAGAPGVCEATGFCSFPDPACPDGRKYEDRAGDGLAGTCVDVDVEVDAGVCGGHGQACCATEPACGASSQCEAGTCASCIADVTFGRHFGCVVGTDGKVSCVGKNDVGQLGFGLAGPPVTEYMAVRESATSTPIQDAIGIGATQEAACAVRAGGTVWCWGRNNVGQLGNNTTIDVAAAVQVQQTDGSPLTNIVALHGGNDHFCGLDDATGVWCWGGNGAGQLGNGTTTLSPVAVQVLDAPAGAVFTGVLALTAGGAHGCAVKAGDEIWCWGRGGNGQLGDGMNTNRPSPVRMVGAGTQVSAGKFTTCRRNPDGTASCAGSSWRSRLGNGTSNTEASATTAVQVLTTRGGPPLASVEQVISGGSSCARLVDGTVKCWGDNVHGQTGAGQGSPVPVEVVLADGTPLTDVVRLHGSFPHACSWRADGEVLCWGRGIDGEHGDGVRADRGHPAPLGYTCP